MIKNHSFAQSRDNIFAVSYSVSIRCIWRLRNLSISQKRWFEHQSRWQKQFVQTKWQLSDYFNALDTDCEKRCETESTASHYFSLQLEFK